MGKSSSKGDLKEEADSLNINIVSSILSLGVIA
jgi:hypothetical protein